MLECRAKQLFKKCNCLPYYYPRLDLLFAAKLAPKHSSTDYKVRGKNDWNNGENVDNMNLSNETYNSYEEEAVNIFRFICYRRKSYPLLN